MVLLHIITVTIKEKTNLLEQEEEVYFNKAIITEITDELQQEIICTIITITTILTEETLTQIIEVEVEQIITILNLHEIN